MPWGVGRRDSCPASKPWAVYLEADGKVVACHRTRERALAHQRALYAGEPGAASQSRSVMHEHMTVPVEWKAAASGAGELSGHASVFGNVDAGGDVVLPGAFRKTLADWSRSKQPLPLIADHDLTTEGVIGSVAEAKEDQVGLWVRARFSSDAKAQSVRTKMIEGHLKGMSFTYETVKHYMGQLAGKSARFLQEVRLFEATVTPFPMNALAVASAKDAMSSASINDLPDSAFAYIEPGGKVVDGKTEPRSLRHFPVHDAAHVRNALARAPQSPFGPKAMPKIRAAAAKFGIHVSESSSLDFPAFAESMRSALAIPAGFAAKAAVDLLVASYHPDDIAAGFPDEEPTAGAAAGTPEGAAGTAETKDAAAYAASFLTPPGPPDGAPDGEPDGLAYPQKLLESVKDAAAMDALEAQINTALGRA